MTLRSFAGIVYLAALAWLHFYLPILAFFVLLFAPLLPIHRAGRWAPALLGSATFCALAVVRHMMLVRETYEVEAGFHMIAAGIFGAMCLMYLALAAAKPADAPRVAEANSYVILGFVILVGIFALGLLWS